jgi:hypothetical protein
MSVIICEAKCQDESSLEHHQSVLKELGLLILMMICGQQHETMKQLGYQQATAGCHLMAMNSPNFTAG